MGFRAAEVHSLHALLYWNITEIMPATRISLDVSATTHTCLAFSEFTV